MSQLPDGCVLKGCEDPWVSYAVEGPCAVTGACCAGYGECQEMSATECAQAGGAYQGDETRCESAAC